MPESLFPETYDQFKEKTGRNVHDLSTTPVAPTLVKSDAPSKDIKSKMGDAARPVSDIKHGIRAALKSDPFIGNLMYQTGLENPFINKLQQDLEN